MGLTHGAHDSDSALTRHSGCLGCPRIILALASVRILVRRGLRPREVLDARCGDGLVALAIARRFPLASVRAQDIDPASITAARRARAASRVSFEVADSLRLPHFDLDFATACVAAQDTGTFSLLVSLRNALVREGLVVIAAHRPAVDLVELATSAGFSRVKHGATRSVHVLELRR